MRIEDPYGFRAARLAASSANEIEHRLSGLGEIGVRGELRMLLSLLHGLQQRTTITALERYSCHGSTINLDNELWFFRNSDAFSFPFNRSLLGMRGRRRAGLIISTAGSIFPVLISKLIDPIG